jgi:hypothetical protein
MESHYVLPLIDAKKGEVFRAFTTSQARLTDYGVIKPERVAGMIRTPCLCFGTGVRLCEEYLSGTGGVTIIKDAFAAVSDGRLIEEALKRSDSSP